MPDDILTKVDRASMSVALEARVPILDHRVVRFAFSLPDAFLWHGGRTKAPLRALLYRRVPRALIERPKQGFGIPIHVLLERELREWSDALPRARAARARRASSTRRASRGCSRPRVGPEPSRRRGSGSCSASSAGTRACTAASRSHE